MEHGLLNLPVLTFSAAVVSAIPKREVKDAFGFNHPY